MPGSHNDILLLVVILIPLELGLWAFPDTTAAQTSSWTAPEEASRLENPLESSDDILSAGKQMYAQLCAVCHGNTGKGDGITASALNPKPADLTSEAVQKQSDGVIYWKIEEGRPPMPGFKNHLSEQQVWAIVHYIRSLHSTEN